MDTRRHRRAVVRAKNQLTLPRDIATALHIGEGDEVEFDVTENGEVVLRGLATVPAEQRWFWEADWQAGEREASEQIASGQTTTYDTADEMFADLER
ncbi:AbrB family transcriptional regulator [Haloactinospora alba]|uniref:AbrB family transcriptional regulator n=1 Tax=Haloactinospora alba TaxID=405555 RepID=A0A543N7G8_9ACTN|nr:AbrB/MazE/SpoVT family DNA-binding domain-containing protein [Haloactinospora alba]TQN27776.1 AbrB family transcriptional regulator [Haloactinospora alba]